MKAQHLSTQEVCLFLGISLSTFYRYCKRGLLKPSFFTLGGHRRFDLHTIKQAFNIDNSAELVVCYSRVSSHDQKKDLATQENKLLAYAQTLPFVKQEQIVSINDLGSGLNYKKKGYKRSLRRENALRFLDQNVLTSLEGQTYTKEEAKQLIEQASRQVQEGQFKEERAKEEHKNRKTLWTGG